MDPETFGKFIADLDSLRKSDPATFLGIIKNMGIGNNSDESSSSKEQDSPEVELEKWTKIFQQFQSGGDGSVVLPGGNATLGPNGVEAKV
jgi:hypothetical protein